ncbi:MAG: hypothetical protein MJ113_02535 [Lachnospiraceae bacterium]|nr:hypothetical protein [Lachnospiraceae bacterium]
MKNKPHNNLALKLAVSLITGLLIVVAVIILTRDNYEVKLVISNDGAFVPEEGIYQNLVNYDPNAEDGTNDIRLASCEAGNYLYEKGGKYYVGENSADTEVSVSYPLYINDATALMFTNGMASLITADFNYVEVYEGLYLSSGITFNGDMEQAYREEFMLVNLGNGLYMNTFDASVTGSYTNEGVIPQHSIINFNLDSIVYYSYDNGKLVLNSLDKVAAFAKITIGKVSFTYLDFLERLGLYSQKAELPNKGITATPMPVFTGEAEETPTPTVKPTAIKLTATPTLEPTSTPTPENTLAPIITLEISPLPIVTMDPSITLEPLMTMDPSITREAGENIHIPGGNDKVTPTPDVVTEPKITGEANPVTTQTLLPTKTPTPTFTATPALKPSEEGSGMEDGGEETIPSLTSAPIPTPTPTDYVSPSYDPYGSNTNYPDEDEEESGTIPGATPTIPPTRTPRPTFTPRPTSTPVPTSTRKPTNTPRPTNTPYIITGGSTGEGDLDRPTKAPLPTSTPRPTNTKRPTPTLDPNYTPEPADPDSVPTPIPPAPISPRPTSTPLPRVTSAYEARPHVHPEWHEPVITLGELTTSVYTISFKDMQIEYGRYLCASRFLQFTVKDEANKTVLVKQYNGTSAVNLGPLRADTNYTVTVEYNYVDNDNYPQYRSIGTFPCRTKPISSMESLKLTFENGAKFSKKLQIQNIGIVQVLENPEAYFESIAYLSRMEIKVENVNNSSDTKTYLVSGTNLYNVRTGKLFTLTTSSNLAPSTRYKYTFKAIDKYGNEIPIDIPYQGYQSTCMDAPSIKFKVAENKVMSLKLVAEISNPDNAECRNIYYSVYDRWGNVIESSVKINGQSVVDTAHPLSFDSTGKSEIHFDSLDDQTLYYIRVFGDYDINDYADDAPLDQRWHCEEKLAETKVTTAAFTSLGTATFDITEDRMTDKEAQFTISFNNKKTNQLLKDVISNITVGVYEYSRNDNQYIKTSYAVHSVSDENYTFSEESFGGRLRLSADDLESFRTNEITYDDGGNEVALPRALTVALGNLNHNTKYMLVIEAYARIGSNDRKVTVIYKPDSFTTNREEAKIAMDTYYAASNFISLFGVGIVDPDRAITEYPVYAYLYNQNKQILDIKKINQAHTIDEIRFDALENHNLYTIRFFAPTYNYGQNESTVVLNRELFVNDRRTPLELQTGQVFSGEITMIGVTDAADVEPELVVRCDNRTSTKAANYVLKDSDYPLITKVYSSPSNKLTRASSSGKYYLSGTGVDSGVVKLDVDFGDKYYNAMELGLYTSSNKWYTSYQVYKENPATNPSAEPISEELVLKLPNTNINRCYWTGKELTFNERLTGKQTLYLKMTNTGETTGGVYHFYGVTFHSYPTENGSAYNANIDISIDNSADSRLQLSSYYVRVFSRATERMSFNWDSTRFHQVEDTEVEGVKKMNCYDYTDGVRGILLESYTFESDSANLKNNFLLPVEGNKYYKLELWVDIGGYQVLINTVQFETDNILIPINSYDDFLDISINLDGHYFVNCDLIVNNANITATQNFNGTIDFNGHSVQHNMNNYIIHTLGPNGVLKNMVYKSRDDFSETTVNSTAVRLVYNNYGTISNLLYLREITYETAAGPISATVKPNTDLVECCGEVVYNNYNTGIIENFVVKYIGDARFIRLGSQIAAYNYGTIRNGYAYTTDDAKLSIIDTLENLEEYYVNVRAQATDTAANNAQTNYNTDYNFAPLAMSNRGIVENCYSIINAEGRARRSADDKANLLVASNIGGIVRNCFAVGDVTYGGVVAADIDPVTITFQSGKTESTYFCSKLSYPDVTSSKAINKELLLDVNFYDNLFNSDNTTTKNAFDLSPVSVGMYPHLYWPECMPVQEYVPLFESDAGQNTIKLLNAVIKTPEQDNEAEVEFSFYNPNGFRIRTVDVDGVSSQVLNQETVNGFTYVLTRLSHPTVYVSEYKVNSFTYSLSGNARVYTSNLNEPFKFNISFYCPVRTVQEFSAIKDNMGQNYRLYYDIDFDDVPINDYRVYISSTEKTFTGEFDGNGHTLKNINLGATRYVFYEVTGLIKDLFIENIYCDEASSTEATGFVSRLMDGGRLDNIHITGAKYEYVSRYAGILCGHTIRNVVISNCSVRDAYVETDYTETTSSIMLGGLVGRDQHTLTITNCYVDNLQIDASRASDVTGIGGLIGNLAHGSHVENVYVTHSSILTNYNNVGGLIGNLSGTGTYSFYGQSVLYVKNYYTDVTISTLLDNAGGMIGYMSKDSGYDNVYGVNFGKIVLRSSMSEEEHHVGPVFGYYDLTTQQTGKNQFAYEDYIIDGVAFTVPENEGVESENSRKAYKRVISYQELTSPSTYGYEDDLVRPKLAWREAFLVNNNELAQGLMPKLTYSDSNELLPGQRDFSIAKKEIGIDRVEVANKYSAAQVSVYIRHGDDVSIDSISDLEFEGFTIDATPGNFSVDTIVENGVVVGTKVWGYVQYTDYFDKYFVKSITYRYTNNPTVDIIQIENFVVDLPPQFLEISTTLEWNNYLSESMHKNKYYNLRILADLEFDPDIVNSVQSRILAHRIEGSLNGTGAKVKISGVTLSGTDNCFIKQATGPVNNIDFVDISISQPASEKSKVMTCFGVFGAIHGAVDNVSFRNITISAQNSSCIAPIGSAYDIISNVTVENVTVLSVYATGRNGIAGLAGRLSGTSGLLNVYGKNIYVEGKTNYASALAGFQQSGTYFENCTVEDSFVSARQYSYAGAICASATSNLMSMRAVDLHVKNSVITGASYVGGIMGQGRVGAVTIASYNTLTSTDIGEVMAKRSSVDNCLIVGVGNSVGGATGRYGVQATDVTNSYIFGQNYVGGICGDYTSIKSCTVDDCVIGSVYDRSVSESTVTTFNDRFIKPSGVSGPDGYLDRFVTRINGWITEAENNASLVTPKDIEDNNYKINLWKSAVAFLGISRTTATKNQSKMGLGGFYYDYAKKGSSHGSNTAVAEGIGGIAGRATSVANCIVTNSTIGTYNGRYVGGVVGYTYMTGYNLTPYSVYSNAALYCEVYGGESVGGIVGRDGLQSTLANYSNADITTKAVIYNGSDVLTGMYTGGIAGLVEIQSGRAISDTPKVIQDIFAGTVTGPSYVGGIVGYYKSNFYASNSDGKFLMLGTVNITSNTGIGNMLYNAPASARKYSLVKSLIGEEAVVERNGVPVVTAASYVSNNRTIAETVTASTLARKDTYVNVLGFRDDTQFFTDNTNYKYMYWDYTDVSSGYLPYIRMVASNNYDRATAYELMPNQVENRIAIPGYDFPIVGFSLFSTARMGARRAEKVEACIYASSADTINVDFSKVDEYAEYELLADDVVIASGNVTERTMTFVYDFQSDLTLAVSSDGGLFVEDYYVEDLRRTVMAAGYNCYYIVGDGVDGTAGKINGNFVNLHSGYMLGADGKVYNTDGSVRQTARRVGQQVMTIPMHQGYYENKKIDTFKTYSVITENGNVSIQNDVIFFTDGVSLQAIRQSDSIKNDSFIIYGADKEYFAALSKDGYIISLLDENFKLPEDFDNSEIYMMSNSNNLETPYCIVRYSNGGVWAFNFITGETVLTANNVSPVARMNLFSMFSGNVPSNRATVAASYNSTKELEDMLSNSMLSIGRYSSMDYDDEKSKINSDYVDEYFVNGTFSGLENDGINMGALADKQANENAGNGMNGIGATTNFDTDNTKALPGNLDTLEVLKSMLAMTEADSVNTTKVLSLENNTNTITEVADLSAYGFGKVNTENAALVYNYISGNARVEGQNLIGGTHISDALAEVNDIKPSDELTQPKDSKNEMTGEKVSSEVNENNEIKNSVTEDIREEKNESLSDNGEHEAWHINDNVNSEEIKDTTDNTADNTVDASYEGSGDVSEDITEDPTNDSASEEIKALTENEVKADEVASDISASDKLEENFDIQETVDSIESMEEDISSLMPEEIDSALYDKAKIEINGNGDNRRHDTANYKDDLGANVYVDEEFKDEIRTTVFVNDELSRELLIASMKAEMERRMEEAKTMAIKEANTQFISVYNASEGNYELYDLEELIKADETIDNIKSMEEKVANAGVSLSGKTNFRAKQSGKDRGITNGVILTVLTAAVALLLTISLILRRREEKDEA